MTVLHEKLRGKDTGYWIIQCTNPLTHKRTTIRRNPKTDAKFKTKKSAQEFELQFLKSSMDLNMKFSGLFEDYCNYLEVHKSGKSLIDMKSRYNRFFVHLKNKKIVNIRESDMNLIVRDMQSNGYHASYINTIITTMKILMNFAVKKGYINSNPITNYPKLKIAKTNDDLKFWTPEQMKQVIESIPEVYKNAPDARQIQHIIRFGYFTGMRYGEIRALRWKDIDFNNNIININNHISKHNTERAGRKNGDYHQLVMDDDTRTVLIEIYENNKKQPEFTNDCYVFHSAIRGPYFPLAATTGNKYMMKLANANGLNHITFHGLRHSHASYLISIVGLSEAEVADRLGDTVAVTSKTYAKFFNQARVRAANKISSHKLGF